jgi:BirA family biotin operon repressor/biotin-[acetyl-CoA-carboxylase] ligase
MGARPSEHGISGRIIQLAEVDSTNAEALRRAATGAAHGTWICAARQTAGRGRRARAWVSDEGNLFASVILRPEISARVAGQLSFVAALALGDAIAHLAPALAADLSLKWPNDVLLAGRKVAGILLESDGGGSPANALVAGFGVNCASHPHDVAFPATSLAAHGAPVAAAVLAERLAISFDKHYESWAGGRGFAAIRGLWLARAAGIGEPVTVQLPARRFSGIFEDLTEEGFLLVRGAGGAVEQVGAGDVFFGDEPDGGGS